MQTEKRLDVQGLRALAVGLVVADHVLGRPAGGFVGVDVFLVVSGFLITGLLLRETERDGRLSLGGFYRRRARRILPVSLLVLVVTVTASYVLLIGDRFERVVVDAGWTLGFAVNWHLASAGTDYFQATLPPSPLQHYWSLAVEEQFYVVWPLLLLAAVALAGPRRARAATAGLAATVVVVSFGWAILQSADQPTLAYFSSLTRAWELAAGALLAAVAHRLVQLSTGVRNALGVVGLAGILAAGLLITPSSAFPAPVGALPVLATLLVLASGIGTDRVAATAPLRVRPLVVLGDLSFSVYLWHWPVLVLGDTLVDGRTASSDVAVVALTLLLATASYLLVERPVLRSRFLLPADGTPRRSGQYVALASLSVLSLMMAVFIVVPRPGAPTGDAYVAPYAAPGASPGATSGAGPTVPPREQAEQLVAAGLYSALTATEFPPLDPPLDDAVDQGITPELEPGAECLNPSSLTDPDLCRHGSGARRAMVVGDSVAIAWMPALEAALGTGWTLRGLALTNCPFADVEIAVPEDPAGSQRCNEAHDAIYEEVRTERPDLVVVSDFELGILRLTGDDAATALSTWRRATVTAIRAVSGPGTRVVILSPPPAGHTAADCYGRSAVPQDCQGNPSDAWVDKAYAERTAAAEAGATYVDTKRWFCVDDYCPLFSGGTVIRWDVAHLTHQYAAQLGDVLRFALPLEPGSSVSP